LKKSLHKKESQFKIALTKALSIDEGDLKKSMVTIYDIAKKTGYSVTTVSKALNNYTDISQKAKDKIMAAVQESGYLPNSHAQSLSTKKSWTIGVVFSEILEVGMKHPFFNEVIESFRKYAEKEGYDLIFVSRNLRSKNTSYLEHFQYRGVDGVVVICSDYEDEQVRQLMDSDLPLVVIDMNNENTSVVYSDNCEGAKLAVEYLYSLGHRKIATIAGHQQTFAGMERLRGFQQAMNDFGLPVNDEFIIHGGFFSVEEGYKAMQQLLNASVMPTAVFAAGDHMAVGAIQAIRDRGLHVPEDISIIGFDDIDLAKYMTPALTTVRQDKELIGEKSAEKLIEQINQKEKKSGVNVIPVELVVRETCKGVD
jgi:LacI family transcriptional regulator